MEIEDLSHDDLLIVMRSVMVGTPVDQALADLIPHEVRRQVNLIHSLYCKEDHTGDGGCNFYIEQEWDTPSHKKWKGVYEDIVKMYNVDIDKLIQYLRSLEAVFKDIEINLGIEGVNAAKYLINYK